ncbi:hypothetical protein [Streptomyces sp. NPDC055036]
MADIPALLALLALAGLAAFGLTLLWLAALAIAHLAALAWWIAVHTARLVTTRRARPAEDRREPGRAGPVLWLACHTPRCGHMQTAHTPDPAGTGLWVCPGCHRTVAHR